MLDVIFGQASNPGKLRLNNEDAMGAFIPRSRKEAESHGWMFVVADGIDGLDFGHVASAKTVAVMVKEFAFAPPKTSLVSLLPGLVQYANTAVRDERLQLGRQAKLMATTVVSCALRHDQAVISHVGDSRCYQVRGGKATAITRDHTVAKELSGPGLVSGEEVPRSGIRHILSRSLGPEGSISADTTTLTLQPGDVLLLCSDGLYGGIHEENIARICSQHKDIQEIAEELVRYAVEVDGSDNATAQVIFVRSVES